MDGKEVALSILGTILIIFGAYFTVYLLGKSTRRGGGRGSRTIKLIDAFYIAKDRMIGVFKIGEKVYIVALSGDGATVMDILTGEEAEQFTAAAEETPAFASGAVKKLSRIISGKSGFEGFMDNAKKKDNVTPLDSAIEKTERMKKSSSDKEDDR